MNQPSAQPRQIDLAQLTAPADEVEKYLRAFLAQRPLPQNLREAIEYALLAPGKRVRPMLVLHACMTLGGETQIAMAPAGAIEMIHAFSLVHDDLPAMDDDDLRRGRPTLHKHTNEAMAILAGDAMTSLAFELIVTRIQDPSLATRLTSELAKATNDMIAGQVYDTLPTEQPGLAEIDRLRQIHRHKTGALLRASCRMGAICAGASDVQIELLTTYADAIGLMFQVVDDLLDVTQTAEAMGKATQKDADKGKLTYPGLLGIAESRREVERLQQAAYEALAGFGPAADPLRELCDYIAVRQN